MKKLSFMIMFFAMFIFTSFHQGEGALANQGEKTKEEAHLKVEMINTEGKKIGEATIKETSEGVKIHLQAENLPPGTRAIHIHEKGVCELPDFASAGAHFNPHGKQHGFQNPKGFHAGDLPNIKVAQDGRVNVEITAPNVTLAKGEKHSLLDKDGSALIIHAKADDYKTDPAGNAGDRIACGVIKK